ncbi:MAG TPA: amino acid permease C-terminal domain-containing protein [Bryobacteraceae bacterium]|nr:amino acid permease C-terminal domain-containing protein [Bryobacteraceae bacterium]
MSLFQKKPLDKIFAESESGEHHLKKTLGPINLVAPGIGCSRCRALTAPPWCRWCRFLGVIVCLSMMPFLDVLTWIRLVVWLLIGFLIYFGYGRKHSHLRGAR